MRPKIAKKIIFSTALFLFFSFTFHTVDFDHDHPHFLGEGVQALLHGEDKKWWVILLQFSFLLPVNFSIRKLVRVFLGYLFLEYEIFIENFIQRALRTGRMQLKLCA